MSPGEPGGDGRRVCLLTGASGALGTSFCTRFADDYDIAGVYHRRWPLVASQDFQPVDPLDPTAPPKGRPIFAIGSDLSVTGACEQVVKDTLNRFGRIDLVVNCAVYSSWGPMLGQDALVDSALHQMHMNVVVPLRMATTVARLYWQSRDVENRQHNRNVVNVSSVAGMRLYPGSGQSVYAASKAALNHLTGHMALEFAAVGVRVNATAANSFPSLVSTERATDAIRHLDVGAANGTVVVVDGEHDEVTRMEPFGA